MPEEPSQSTPTPHEPQSQSITTPDDNGQTLGTANIGGLDGGTLQSSAGSAAPAGGNPIADAANTPVGATLSNTPPPSPSNFGARPGNRLLRRSVLTAGSLVLLTVLIAGGFFAQSRLGKSKVGSGANSTAGVADTSLDLSGVKVGAANPNSQQINVNGLLKVNNSLQLAPIDKPDTLEAGQIYVDSADGSLYYYDGTDSVAIAGSASDNFVVTSLNGETGDIELIAGDGIDITDNVITNTGLTEIPDYLSSSGNPTFADMTITSLNPNGVVLTDAANSLQTVSTPTNGLCLVSGAGPGGAPGFTSCSGVSGVSSLNGLTGGLTIANAGTSGSTITINDAVANGSTKGIAAFSSTNFKNTSNGVIDTIQGIGNGATPLFSGLTLSNALTVLNGGTGATSASAARTNLGAAAKGTNADILATTALNDITPNGALTVGSLSYGFTLQGTDSSTIVAKNTSTGFSTTINFNSPTHANTITFPNGSGTICVLEVGNCTGAAGVSASGATTGKIAKFTGANSIANSIISDDGTNITVAGGAIIQNAVTFKNSNNPNTISLQASTSTSGTNPILTLPINGGSSGQCLTTNGGSPTAVLSWVTCLSGSGPGGGVTSLNGNSGALTLNNASAPDSSHITINDAVTNSSTKGIATFTAANFKSLSAGVIDTIQGINTSDTPQFAGLTLSSGGILTANNFVHTGAGQDITIDAGADGIVFKTNSGDTFLFPTGGGAGQTICTTGVNCVAGGGLAVQLGPNAMQTDNSANASIFFDDEGGGNLLQLRSGGNDVFIVDNSGHLTVGDTISTLGGGADQLTINANNRHYTLPTIGGVNQTICTDAGNCSGGGGPQAVLLAPGSAQQNASDTDTSIIVQNTGAALLLELQDSFANDVLSVDPNGTTTIGQNGTLSFASGANFDQSGSSGTFATGTGNATLNGDTTFATDKSLSFASGTGNFDQSNSSGTFATGTGAVSLNGATTVASNIGFTANGDVLFADATDSATAFAVQNSTAGQILAVDTSGNQVVLGNAGSLAGQLTFANASNANTVSLVTAVFGQNTTLTIPDPQLTADDFCLRLLGNCAGSGGGVTTNGGTPKALALFTGGQQIDDSIVTQNAGDDTITVAGTLEVQTALALDGNSGHTVSLQAGTSMTGSTVLTLPSDVGQLNDCLVTDGNGQLSFAACGAGGGGGGVTSLNGETGDVVVDDASHSGGHITIHDALADGSTKGIATFDGNFSDNGSGLISTVQDIDQNASPQFNAVSADTFDSKSAGELDIGTTNATQINLNQNTQLSANHNLTFESGNGNFDQSASSGTFKTGTGAATLNGATTVKNTATGAFAVQNASGLSALSVNTTAGAQTNLISNGNFESPTNTTGWAPKGSGTSLGVNSSNHYLGAQSMSITTTTTANAGASFNVTLAANKAYTLTMAIIGNGAYTDIALGRQDVSGTDASCINTRTLATSFSSSLTELTCSFTTGATISSSNIYVQKTGAAAETFYIDQVELHDNSGTQIVLGNASGTLTNGQLTFLSDYGGKTTIQSAAVSPGVGNILTLPSESGTICTDNPLSNCSVTGDSKYLFKNAADTSMGTVNNGTLYTFTNTNGTALTLNNSNTGNTANPLVLVANGQVRIQTTGGNGLAYQVFDQAGNNFQQINTSNGHIVLGNSLGAAGPIDIGLGNLARTISIGDGGTSQSVTVDIGSTSGASSTQIHGSSSGCGLFFLFGLCVGNDAGTNLLIGDYQGTGSNKGTTSIYGTGGVSINGGSVGLTGSTASSIDFGGFKVAAVTAAVTGGAYNGFQFNNGSNTIKPNSTGDLHVTSNGNSDLFIDAGGNTGTVKIGTLTTAPITIGATGTSAVTSINGGSNSKLLFATGSSEVRASTLTALNNSINVGGTGNAYIFPGSGGTVCIANNPCAGAGTVTTSGSPSNNTIALFSGSTVIGNSVLTQSSGNITVGSGGNLTVQGATTATGGLTVGTNAGVTINGGTVNNALFIGQPTQNYIWAENASNPGTANFKVSNTGAVTSASSINGVGATISGTVTLGASGSVAVGLGGSSQYTNAVCSSLGNATNPTASSTYTLTDCNSTPAADFAERYPAASSVAVGDVVAQGSTSVPTYNADSNGNVDYSSVKGHVSQVVRAATPYSSQLIGVASDNDSDFASVGNNIKSADNPIPIALVGRVPVKVTNENGDIEPGDSLTASATKPGYAMKATQAGYVIGQALASFADNTPGLVMVFVRGGYYAGPTIGSTLQNGGSGTLANLNITGTADVAGLNVSGNATLATLNVTGVTTLKTLVVNGDATFNGTLSVNGHIITGNKDANPTTVAAGPAACTAPTVSISGNDSSGTITITTGTGCSSVNTTDPLATVTFGSAYGANPRVTLTPASSEAAKLQYYFGATATPNATFEIDSNTKPTNATTYKYNYLVAQ